MKKSTDVSPRFSLPPLPPPPTLRLPIVTGMTIDPPPLSPSHTPIVMTMPRNPLFCPRRGAPGVAGHKGLPPPSGYQVCALLARGPPEPAAVRPAPRGAQPGPAGVFVPPRSRCDCRTQSRPARVRVSTGPRYPLLWQHCRARGAIGGASVVSGRFERCYQYQCGR